MCDCYCVHCNGFPIQIESNFILCGLCAAILFIFQLKWGVGNRLEFVFSALYSKLKLNFATRTTRRNKHGQVRPFCRLFCRFYCTIIWSAIYSLFFPSCSSIIKMLLAFIAMLLLYGWQAGQRLQLTLFLSFSALHPNSCLLRPATQSETQFFICSNCRLHHFKFMQFYANLSSLFDEVAEFFFTKIEPNTTVY